MKPNKKDLDTVQDLVPTFPPVISTLPSSFLPSPAPPPPRFPIPSLKSHSLPSSTSPPVLLGTPDLIRRQQSALKLQPHITTNHSHSQPPILCAIVGLQIEWTKSFFTFGPCPAAMELGAWKAQAGQFNPGEEARFIPKLLEEMAITPSNLL